MVKKWIFTHKTGCPSWPKKGEIYPNLSESLIEDADIKRGVIMQFGIKPRLTLHGKDREPISCENLR